MRASTPAAPLSPASDDVRAKILSAVVICTILFNFALCFVNTNLFRTGAGVVIGCEMALIGIMLALLITRSFDLFVILGVYVAYTLFLAALQASFDPKPARDLMIPVIFYFAARELGSREDGDRLVRLSVWIVLIVGLLEYGFLKQFVRLFDILGYYVSRGTVQAAAAELSGDRLFASGMRYEGRTLLPWPASIASPRCFSSRSRSAISARSAFHGSCCAPGASRCACWRGYFRSSPSSHWPTLVSVCRSRFCPSSPSPAHV